MAAPLSLRLLYSANLRGDMWLLPRLFSFMQRLKTETGRDCLLLDLGNACSDAVWHCRQTDGRSMLIALDGMGYHAANVDGTLDAPNRQQLATQVTTALVDREHDWRYKAPAIADTGIVLTLRPSAKRQCAQPQNEARLQICLMPARQTHIKGRTLFLRDVCAGQVGAAHIDLRGTPCVMSHAIHDLPPNTPPNPSIAGTVEFVQAEARLYHKNRGKSAP